jgi:hypothetical protein
MFLAAGEDEPVRKGTAFQVLSLSLALPTPFTFFNPTDMASWI